ncbi:MAG TPA: cell division protein ZapA [Candidatus Hydrogenedentes bacterium]|nr:cell division protein ZapA [Candidatus Hydrogenedentota bacterium]HOL75774.1 cell division protein ZapA [Candidatus Hydrogenedentota bacterium]HPO84232.1 cell division protein ZapA [Candidatus Hydrogenedentota bacterium]
MSADESYIECRIAGVNLRVPVCQDESTTKRIVELVNKRLKEIESASSRIDTQKFALLAAYSFATELQDLMDRQAQEERSLARLLEEVGKSLRELLEKAQELEEQE